MKTKTEFKHMSSFRTATPNGMRERTTTRASERREATDQHLQFSRPPTCWRRRRSPAWMICTGSWGARSCRPVFTIVKMWLPNQVDVVLTIRLDELDEVLGLPIIRRNLTIYGYMRFRMHMAGTEMPLRYAAGLTAEPGIFHSATEALNVMARLKSLRPDNMDLKSAAAELLDRAVDADGADELSVCQFAAEQLRLASVPPNRRCYSQALMSLAVMWDSNGHAFIKILRMLAGQLFNIFTSNYAAEANSSIHASSSSAPSTMATRTRAVSRSGS